MILHSIILHIEGSSIAIIITRRVPVEREIINGMMCLKYRIILTRGQFYSHIFRFGAPPRTPLGRLQRRSDPSTFPHAALRLPFRHLAINLFCRRAVATSMRKLQRKHRKIWRNYDDDL